MPQRGGVERAKTELRTAARARRAAAHAACAQRSRDKLCAAGLGFLGRAPGIVSGFHPYTDEIDCTGLMARLAQEGWTTCLPVVVAAGQALEFRVWRPGEPLEPGAWGILAPLGGAAVVRPDVLLVPLLAFDAQGYRLGYGGGFYDRSLAALRRDGRVTAVGVAFAAQEVGALPRAPHDEPLDWILTESGARRFETEAAAPRRRDACA
jgi:5-formyltetrahydrofolate cyclo-ligase